MTTRPDLDNLARLRAELAAGGRVRFVPDERAGRADSRCHAQGGRR
jgi:hypothetical protein